VEAKVLEMHRSKPFWGARRLALDLTVKGVKPAPSESVAMAREQKRDIGHALKTNSRNHSAR